MKTLTATDLSQAEKGSYYTIVGTGEPLSEWLEGYEKLLAEQEIGKPQEWFMAKGCEVNAYVITARPEDQFKSDLTFLMFPLDGLHVGRLAMFKMQMEDRWFDDIVHNMRSDW